MLWRALALGLRGKFRISIAVAACGLVTLSVFWLESEKGHLLAEKQRQAVKLVALPLSVIAEEHALEESGAVSRAEAQRRALRVVRAMRYEGDNYFWVIDMQSKVMLMHPLQPQLESEDITPYKDSAGRSLVAEMVQLVNQRGRGFVSYQWQKPGSSRPAVKQSYVEGYAPWGWVVGTGIYVDDVNADWRKNTATAGGLATAWVVLLLVVWAATSRSLFGRLEMVVGRMKEIASGKGDFSKGIEENAGRAGAAGDEIDVLIAGFNEMMGEIRQRDEQLRKHGEELEREVAARTDRLRVLNYDLAAAHAETALFLECIPSILIGLDAEGKVTLWNLTATQTFGLREIQVRGKNLDECGIRWLQRDMQAELKQWLLSQSVRRCEDLAYEREGSARFVGFSVRPVFSKQKGKTRFIVTGADVTQKKCLEEQLRQAHKLEAIGQLAAGIAHEINTPTQYIGDNTTFLKESWQSILELLDFCRRMQEEAGKTSAVSRETLAAFDRRCEEADLEFLSREIPHAIDESLNGLQQVARIVRAMKEFSHAGSDEKQMVDLNRAIEATITVAKSEWKHVAEVESILDPDLPQVSGLAGELKQVILNLIVNAAHAIGDVVGDGSKGKGKITVTTHRAGDNVEIAISDTGPGIPEKIRSRVFELFFTTKPVGKGTGQGLSVAHTIVVKRHQGQIWFETEVGKGTTFFVRLPLEAAKAAAAK